MKIKYQFANESIEIEVSDDWGNILIDLGRQEYNVNQKETRRHVSLNGMDYEGDIFADEIDIEELILKEEMSEVLRAAIRKLKPQQQELIYALYLSERPMSQAEYGKQIGIEETSVQQNARRAKARLREIINNLKKFL
ncbi:RNA polymerase sigma-70 factor (ECF subfamily) [Ruminiclostridium sufflavum DSM 19573]|uniref:RNA polymerase sigma-70 factor (ECF subfamily) n=1 Tax=Ruminiclostridium sufflavum DSM 19573 TaxID=1121337 RepID=A0A318XFS9_9FIRM|nr:sigma-70 family RNA polymerase sigma factor [Ruminiclostridium sufflavum]PYG84777.1 RNA polymerase sigma-70 factor (ECF subfamily) [Ruminiclostridium sufflavum DSM 19573]